VIIEEELQHLLQIVHPLYEEIHQQRAHLLDLETVPLARDMYKQALKLEEEQLSLLQKRKQALEEERSILQRSREAVRSRQTILSTRRHRPNFSTWNTSPLISVREVQNQTTIDRVQIQKLINRWKFFWKIDPTIIGQFNRIVVNVERPIGEALILLNWSLYQEGIYAGEGPVSHLERLKQWHQALMEYHVWLDAEFHTQQERFQGLLPVWEIWRQRDLPDGNERWQLLIEHTRQAKQAEIVRFTQEINETSQEIIRIKEEEQV
jgi:hypothetical protein